MAFFLGRNIKVPQLRKISQLIITIIQSGGQPNVAQEDGETCLHVAARNGNKAIMRYKAARLRYADKARKVIDAAEILLAGFEIRLLE